VIADAWDEGETRPVFKAVYAQRLEAEGTFETKDFFCATYTRPEEVYLDQSLALLGISLLLQSVDRLEKKHTRYRKRNTHPQSFWTKRDKD